jgi:hypothetical protein
MVMMVAVVMMVTFFPVGLRTTGIVKRFSQLGVDGGHILNRLGDMAGQ